MHLSIKSSQHAQLWSKLPFNVGVDFEKVLNVSSYLTIYYGFAAHSKIGSIMRK